MSQARFYNIATVVNPDYDKEGYLTEDMVPGLQERIDTYVVQQKLNIGDVLFVGSTYETRQEYGFYMVLPDRKGLPVAQAFEGVVYAPNDPRIRTILQQTGVLFNALFKQMADSEEFQFMFFPDDEDEKTEIIANYRAYGLF